MIQVLFWFCTMLKCQALGQDCVADVSSAYALLEAVNRQQLDAQTTAPKVAAMLIRAVEKRSSEEKIRGSFSRGHTSFDFLNMFMIVFLDFPSDDYDTKRSCICSRETCC